MRSALVALLVLATLLSATADAFRVVGHRGAGGYRPDNTISSFQMALAIGADMVEADVVVTRDFKLVASHERRLTGRLCRGPYVGRLINRLTLRQVRRMRCGGEPIPTLGQIMGVVKRNRAQLLVELKIHPGKPHQTASRRVYARLLRGVLRRRGMVRRVSVQSYDWGALRAVRRVEPRLKLFGLVTRGTPRVAAADRAGFNGIAPNRALVTPAMVAAAHRRSLEVIPYTVDAPEEMARLIGLGVDGIITDFPDRLRQQARAAGYR